MNLVSCPREPGAVETPYGAATDHSDFHRNAEVPGTPALQDSMTFPRWLLGAEDGVFGRFGDAEFDDALGRDVDGLTFVGAELHRHLPRRAIDQHQLAQPGQGES